MQLTITILLVITKEAKASCVTNYTALLKTQAMAHLPASYHPSSISQSVATVSK
jgi:hypothetical protein